jgi:hypothetical protein
MRCEAAILSRFGQASGPIRGTMWHDERVLLYKDCVYQCDFVASLLQSNVLGSNIVLASKNVTKIWLAHTENIFSIHKILASYEKVLRPKEYFVIMIYMTSNLGFYEQ